MRRRDRLVLRFIMWLAVGTFLFGVWAMVFGVGKVPPQTPLPGDPTNVTPATSQP